MALTARLDSLGKPEEKVVCCCLKEKQSEQKYQVWGWHRCFTLVNTEIIMYSWLTGVSQLAYIKVLLQVNFILFSVNNSEYLIPHASDPMIMRLFADNI